MTATIQPSNASELLPCPFCGGSNVGIRNGPADHWVACISCGLEAATSRLMMTGVAGNHGWSVIPLYAGPQPAQCSADIVELVTDELLAHGEFSSGANNRSNAREAARAVLDIIRGYSGMQNVDADLVQRCRELLEWSATGLLAGGNGGAVRALAERLKETVGERYALNIAESQTRDDAMRAVVATVSALSSAERRREDLTAEEFKSILPSGRACQLCGEVAPLRCGPSRFGSETWACEACWNPQETSSISSTHQPGGK